MTETKSDFPIILGLSGPPRSGKDTSAEIIIDLLSSSLVGIERMSWALKEIATVFMPPDSRRNLESQKDRPMNDRGTTYRQVQIEVFRLGASLFGPDWLGHRLLHLLHFRKNKKLIIVPDFGRPEEVQVLIDAGLTVRQIKIRRRGTTYEGDSRVDFTLFHIKDSWLVLNDGSLEDLRAELLIALKNLLPTNSGFDLPPA